MFSLFELPATTNWAGFIIWFVIMFSAVPFLRYVVGIRHWRNSTAITFAISLWLFLSVFRRWYIGTAVWLYLFFAGLAFGVAVYKYLRLKPIHYYVKVSLVILGIFMGFFVALWGIYSLLGVVLLRSQEVSASLILLLSTVYEYVVLYSRKGTLEFIRRGVATGLVGFIWATSAYYDPLLQFISTYQAFFIIGLVVLLVFILARWNYLTVVEFFRFRPILEAKRD